MVDEISRLGIALEVAEREMRSLKTHREMVTSKLGTLIRLNREQQELSLRSVARDIGVTASYLSDMELGRRPISSKNLQKIRKALSLP